MAVKNLTWLFLPMAWLWRQGGDLVNFQGLIDVLSTSKLTLLARFMGGIATFGAFMLLLHILKQYDDVQVLPGCAAVIALTIVAWTVEVLQRKDRSRLAIIVASYAAQAIIVFILLFTPGGFRSLEIAYMPMIMMLSGWLLGGRHSLMIYGLQTAALLLVWRFNPAPTALGGIDPVSVGLSPHWVGWVNHQMIITIAVGLSLTVGRAFQTAMEQVERLAALDALTDLPNRRTFDTVLKEQFTVFVRHGQPLSLVLIDVDGFKQINDQNSHPAGDLVLVTVANLFKARRRAGDFCARLGGDEFAFVLPSTDEVGALKMANDLLSIVREHVFVLPPHQRTWPVTLSIGVAQLSDDTRDTEDLYSNADQALYASKRRGRNCATAYSQV